VLRRAAFERAETPLRLLHALMRSLPHAELHRALRSKYSHFSLNSVALTPPLANPPF
jgi:hypothetical protein